MPPYRDVAEFNDRAASYDHGWRGRLHHQISERTASLAVATVAAPNRVLDVGCGTGYLLRDLASRYPDAEQLVGIDAAPAMVKTANAIGQEDRLTFVAGVAEAAGLAASVLAAVFLFFFTCFFVVVAGVELSVGAVAACAASDNPAVASVRESPSNTAEIFFMVLSDSFVEALSFGLCTY